MPTQIAKGDDLKTREKTAAGEAVDLLNKATERMTRILKHDLRAPDAVDESLKAYQETEKAGVKIAEVHRMRKEQL